MRDVVYLLNQEGLPEDGIELRYSLRSLANMPHGRVWMVGGKPDWVRNVNHVPHPDHKDGKWFTLMAKFAAVPSLDTTPVVHMMADDFFITDPVDTVPPYYTNTLAERAKELFAARGPHSLYAAIYRDTLQHLGPDARNHGIHVPQTVETAAIPVDLLTSSPLRLSAPSLTGNLQAIEAVKLERDYKVRTPEEFAVWKKSGSPFLSTNERTFQTSGARAYLHRLFPDPCEYEEA